MWCFLGHKLTRVQEDGYQYCEACGKAFVPPELELPACNHKWKIIKSIDVVDVMRPEAHPIACIEVLQCEHCGTVRQVEIELTRKTSVPVWQQ